MSSLIQKAQKIRLDAIALSQEHKNGHLASALSMVELLVMLYEKVLTKDDQFILSKGHGALSLYAVLKDKGLNPTVAHHPDIEREQGIECSSGSLGHGLPIGVGKALAKKIKGEPGTIFVLMGDGECQEGTIWESLNIIRKFELNNIVPIVDHNKLQALDSVKTILEEDNLKAKFEAFGMRVLECDGHDFGKLEKVFGEGTRHEALGTKKLIATDEHGQEIKESSVRESPWRKKTTPAIILAHTVKGKGISFMENVPGWHSRMMDQEQVKRAVEEINSHGRTRTRKSRP